MSMTLITLMDIGGSGDTMYIGDQLDAEIVASLGRTIYPALVGIDEISMAPSSRHGGFVSARYGTITIAIDAFVRAKAAQMSSLWPPPKEILIEALEYHVDTSTVIAPLASLTPLTGWLTSMSAEGVTYAIYPVKAQAVIEDGAFYSGTLDQVFYAAAAKLGVLLDKDYSRAYSPEVYYRADGKVSIMDALDAIARFFTHRCYLAYSGAGVLCLYLVDMYRDHGVLALAGNEWESIEYAHENPHAVYTAQWTQSRTTRLRLAIDDTSPTYNSCVLSRARVFYGSVELARAALASNEAAGFPATNLVDTDPATAWISGPGTIPGTDLYIATTPEKKITEYRLTSYNNATPYAPARWRLYGWHEALFKYYPLGEVESTGWGALEERTFSVPECQWPVEYPSAYPYGDTYAVSPTCARTHAQVSGALANINTIVNGGRVRIRVTLPIRGGIEIGMRITLTDTLTCSATVPGWTSGTSGTVEQVSPSLSVWLHVDSISYDLANQSMVIEGEGNVT